MSHEFTFSEQIDSSPTAQRSPVIVGLVFLLLLGMVGMFLIDRLYNPTQFQIKQVEVIGQFDNVDVDQVREIVAKTLDGNYFSANLELIEYRIRNMPWVFEASVRRQWPSTLRVEIEEVQPIAEWGEKQWLNATGDLVDRESETTELPVLDGPPAMREVVWNAFNQWHGRFAAHGISLDRLRFDERELWYLTLSLTALALDRNELVIEADQGQSLDQAEVTMIVDNGDASARIERLIKALNDQLIAEFPSMKSIDLRYPNGFAIDWVSQPPDPNEISDSAN